MPKYLLGAFYLLFKVKNMAIDAVSNNFPQAALDKNAAGMEAGSGKKAAKTSSDDMQEVRQLAETDRKVRAHEAAHMAAGGQYIRGGATFQYQKGPDGKMYAVGGEVSIDVSPVRNDPRATISKMEVVKSAAMAPANPSGQDRAVASAASAAEAQARQEVAQETSGGDKKGNETTVIGSSNKEPSKTSLYNGKGDTIDFSKGIQDSLLSIIA
jgi:hypothetical protein